EVTATVWPSSPRTSQTPPRRSADASSAAPRDGSRPVTRTSTRVAGSDTSMAWLPPWVADDGRRGDPGAAGRAGAGGSPGAAPRRYPRGPSGQAVIHRPHQTVKPESTGRSTGRGRATARPGGRVRPAQQRLGHRQVHRVGHLDVLL